MNLELSEFLENFSPILLQHREPESDGKPWVFWSQYDVSQNNSTSADRKTRMIYEKIKSAFHSMVVIEEFICQFWAPVTIDGRQLLSTSGQPFAVSNLYEYVATYRLNAEKYQYIIEDNNLDMQRDPLIISGGPAIAFLNRMPYIDDLVTFPLEPDIVYKSSISIMIPISSPSRSCIGVVECTVSEYEPYEFCTPLVALNSALKEAGLDVFDVQSYIPYRTIDGLRPARDKIAKALEIVCGSHNISLAQVWIAYENLYNVPFSSPLEGYRTKRMIALKLTGYLSAVNSGLSVNNLGSYYTSCDVVPQETGELALRTLQNYESHYISKVRLHRLMYDKPWDLGSEYLNCGLAICLRSTDTGDFDYAFEFIWRKHSNISIMLEALLLTLKRCLPSFKLASGAELGDELNVIDVESSTTNAASSFKIFQGMKNGKKPSEVKCMKSLIPLPREVIEKQFGRTIMNEAAKNLNVSESTLKRKFNDLGMPEWPGPNLMNRKANVSSIIQMDDEVIPDPSTLIIKAHYGVDDIIKFCLPMSQATFENVDKEIRINFKLTPNNYKINYVDEFGDWMFLTSDEEMRCCMESFRNLNRAIVDLHVIPSPQPISGPSCSYSTY